jgi:hypothetical protein
MIFQRIGGIEMKKLFLVLFITLIMLLSGSMLCTAADFKDLNMTIGKVRISKPFIHAGKDFEKGIYWVTLTAKDGIPYFNIHNPKKELLFEELAIVKPFETTSKKFTPHVTKGFLKSGKYFRIKVKRPDAFVLCYLLLKQEEPPKKEEPKQETEKQEVEKL